MGQRLAVLQMCRVAATGAQSRVKLLAAAGWVASRVSKRAPQKESMGCRGSGAAVTPWLVLPTATTTPNWGGSDTEGGPSGYTAVLLLGAAAPSAAAPSFCSSCRRRCSMACMAWYAGPWAGRRKWPADAPGRDAALPAAPAPAAACGGCDVTFCMLDSVMRWPLQGSRQRDGQPR